MTTDELLESLDKKRSKKKKSYLAFKVKVSV